MNENLFDTLKARIINADPVSFAETNLTLDGEPFRVNGNGYKPFADIYRYVGLCALEKNSLPTILVKGRQVGASTMLAALSLFWAASGRFGIGTSPPLRVYHVFPLGDQALNYTKKKLNTIISTALPDPNYTGKKTKTLIQSKLDTSIPSNDSLKFKQFLNNNTISIESIGLDGGRLRGSTSDILAFDEIQNMRPEAISNVMRMTTKSKYGPEGVGVNVFFGTPLSKGSEFYKMWQQSSMQYYYLGCEACGEHFPFYTPGSNDWEKIWIEDDLPKNHKSHGFIVQCTKCQHKQDKRAAAEIGKWVSLAPEGSKINYNGYHLTCLLMPEFSRQRIMDEKPENSPINSERTFQNEILGEFYSGTAGPISLEEIDAKCAEPREMVGSISAKSNGKKIFAGFDWGEKNEVALGEDSPFKNQGKSYSCGVILTADGPNLLSLQFATRLKKNDMEYKLMIVDEMYRLYNIDLAVGDIGGAFDLSDTLHKKYGGKFLTSRAVGSAMKHHATFTEDRFPPEIQFEKDYYYAELYEFMRKGLLRFPYKSYDRLEWLLFHITQGNDIKVKMDTRGELKSHFVKSGANDGFCALLNAYLAWKYYVTDGFKLHDPKAQERARSGMKDNKIMALLGYLPKMKG
jgi:hypothetical protein